MDRWTYHKEKKSVGQTHQLLSSISNMGRSGTQTVYNGNRKGLLQDEGRHEKNSVKGHRELQQGSWDPHQEETRAEIIYWSNTRIPLTFLLKTEEKENRLHFFFLRTSKLQTFSSRLLHQKRSSRYLKPKAKKKIWLGSFLSCNQKSERKEEKLSTVNLELPIRKMDQPGKALRRMNEFSSITTASKGPHDYWKAPEWFHQWGSL